MSRCLRFFFFTLVHLLHHHPSSKSYWESCSIFLSSLETRRRIWLCIIFLRCVFAWRSSQSQASERKGQEKYERSFGFNSRTSLSRNEGCILSLKFSSAVLFFCDTCCAWRRDDLYSWEFLLLLTFFQLYAFACCSVSKTLLIPFLFFNFCEIFMFLCHFAILVVVVISCCFVSWLPVFTCLFSSPLLRYFFLLCSSRKKGILIEVLPSMSSA